MGVGQGTSWMSRQLIAGPLLMAVAASQGANCTSGATLGFSILLKDTSTCSSVLPWGARIRTSDLLITRQPALPTELQPPLTSKFLLCICESYFIILSFFFWWIKVWLSVLSLNVRGSRDLLERKVTFLFCRNTEADLIFSQETHSSESNVKFWKGSEEIRFTVVMVRIAPLESLFYCKHLKGKS